MRYLTFFSVLIFWVNSVRAQPSKSFVLRGTTLHTGKVYLMKFEDKIFKAIDSTIIDLQTFQFTTHTKLPELYGLSMNKARVPYYIFLENRQMFVDYDTANAYKNTVVKATDNRNGLVEPLQQDLYLKYRKSQGDEIDELITLFPSSIVTAYILYRNYSHRLPPHEIENKIEQLIDLEETQYVKILKNLVVVLRSAQIGKPAKDFALPDINGKVCRLSDYRGKYVLLDFWASWCIPCRKENPNVVKAWERFRDKGFTIIGVSLDSNKDAWKQAIVKDGLTWTNLSDLQFWNNAAAKDYGVRAIPKNFLIDPNGIIIAADLKGQRLQFVLDSILQPQKNAFTGQAPIVGVSTLTKPIEHQVKQTFTVPGSSISISNDFDGGRLNGIKKVNDTLVELYFSPENMPVNESPWYAFKAWAAAPATTTFRFTYPAGYGHRYPPKISRDGINWQLADTAFSNSVQYKMNGSYQFHVSLSPDTLWIAAQELITSTQVDNWITQLKRKIPLKVDTIGYSHQQRPVQLLKIGNLKSNKRILISGRLHPPEVTGHYALKAFLETICDTSSLSKHFLKDFLVYVIPLPNPDGVDGGFWRHNAGGVDLNRDWHEFNQPETRAIRDFLSRTIRKDTALLFSIDFHSTWDDIYYTVDTSLKSAKPDFITTWLNALKESLPGYQPMVKPLYSRPPTYTLYSYLFQSYKTESLVYEIGDNTPREFIYQKSSKAARLLMTMLDNKKVN